MIELIIYVAEFYISWFLFRFLNYLVNVAESLCDDHYFNLHMTFCSSFFSSCCWFPNFFNVEKIIV